MYSIEELMVLLDCRMLFTLQSLTLKYNQYCIKVLKVKTAYMYLLY
jgi:hypothetical protein